MQERFKQLLDEKKLTATRFAALIKVNASAMSHILNGRSKPGFDVLDKIAQAFPEVNLNWLISGKGSVYNRSLGAEDLPGTPENTTIPREEEEENRYSARHDTPADAAEPAPLLPSLSETSAPGRKKVKRIVLFFEDGSFEDYER